VCEPAATQAHTAPPAPSTHSTMKRKCQEQPAQSSAPPPKKQATVALREPSDVRNLLIQRVKHHLALTSEGLFPQIISWEDEEPLSNSTDQEVLFVLNLYSFF